MNLIEIACRCASSEEYDSEWCQKNCPYFKDTPCRDRLIMDLADKFKELKSAYITCLEALEEYEKAEKDRPIFTKSGMFISDYGSWSITLDD